MRHRARIAAGALSLVCMAGGGGQAAAQQPAEFTVALSPVVPPAGTNLRWSPKGAVVALRRDGGALVGAFPLGDSRADSVGVKLDRMQGAAHFDVLWVDTDRNGRWSANERFATTPTLIRGEWWSSFDNVVVRVPEADGGSRPYPMALWFVADTSEPDAPPQLRWSRRGWHAGEVAIGGKPAYVLITEFEMDGVFDQRDAWAISRDSMALLKADARKLDEHAWLDGVAYRPTKIDPDGRSISFVKIDPGTTEAEEIAKKDIYAPDRAARRAAVPLAFDTSLAGALARARRDHRRVLIAFDAVWCGPCHVMDQLVYTAADVVAAAGNVIAVKVDGDEHRDLKQRYKVDGFPTVILLDSDGKELRRGVGYQSVADMVALLRK